MVYERKENEMDKRLIDALILLENAVDWYLGKSWIDGRLKDTYDYVQSVREKIRKELDSTADFIDSSSLKEAVEIGFKEASAGEVVLLAPACTSFDMFQNFEERGKIFKQEIFGLKKQIKGEKAAE